MELVELIFPSIEEFTQEKGRPPYCLELLQSVTKKGKKDTTRIKLEAHVYNLFRDGRLFADRAIQKFALQPEENKFYSFSEIFEKQCPGYDLDDKGLLKAGKANSINLQDLLQVLLSKDRKHLENV